MKNKLAAFYEIMCANDFNPNLYEEFLEYQLKQRIEEHIIRKTFQDRSSVDIDNLIKFQQIFAKMQEEMQNVLTLFISFWKELQDESPNFQRLGSMGHEISQLAISIRGQYRLLTHLNPTNLYYRMLYALFVKTIMKDEFEALDIYDETNRATNNLRIQNNHFYESKLGFSDRTSLFIIRCAKDNIGNILCINTEVQELLGYEKHEILGQNISKVMPPIIGENHSEIVLSYLASGNQIQTNEKIAFALHKKGYVIPCICIVQFRNWEWACNL